MLIDGMDDRGIDVGLMTKADYELIRIRSHIDDRDADGVIFSRDCPEYTVKTPIGERLVLLVNHLARSCTRGDVQTPCRTCSATTSSSTCSRSAPPAASSRQSRPTTATAIA